MSISTRVKIAISIGLICSTLSIFTPQVFAQAKPALDLTIFPATTYLSVVPGKSITHHILVQYAGTQPVQVTPEVRDFIANGQSGMPVIQDTTSFDSIVLDDPTHKLGEPFVMHPNTKMDFILTIKPSPKMIEKEYPLVFTVKAEPLPDRVGDDITAASGIIASNMIVWVSTDGETRGKITILDFPMPRFVDSFGHVSIDALAENVGDHALAPKGTITLHHWRGKQLGRWFIFPDVILAKSTRLVRTITTDPAQLTEDDEPTFEKMAYDEPFLLGPYNITTQLENPDGSTEQRSITVFAFPFSIIIAILAVISLYIAYLQLLKYLNEKRW